VLLARQGFGRHLIALEVVGFAVVGVAAAAWVFSIVRYPNVLARRRELVAAAGGFVCLLSVGELVLAAT
jgi:hypothetical protein